MAKFFTYDQNNSGGHFEVNNDVCEYVIIEAENYKQANAIAEEIGIYFNGCNEGIDCDCCGDRWYEAEEYDDGYDEPMIYNKPVEEYSQSVFRKQCIIHYLNGTRKTVVFK